MNPTPMHPAPAGEKPAAQVEYVHPCSFPALAFGEALVTLARGRWDQVEADVRELVRSVARRHLADRFAVRLVVDAGDVAAILDLVYPEGARPESGRAARQWRQRQERLAAAGAPAPLPQTATPEAGHGR